MPVDHRKVSTLAIPEGAHTLGLVCVAGSADAGMKAYARTIRLGTDTVPEPATFEVDCGCAIKPARGRTDQRQKWAYTDCRPELTRTTSAQRLTAAALGPIALQVECSAEEAADSLQYRGRIVTVDGAPVDRDASRLIVSSEPHTVGVVCRVFDRDREVLRWKQEVAFKPEAFSAEPSYVVHCQCSMLPSIQRALWADQAYGLCLSGLARAHRL